MKKVSKLSILKIVECEKAEEFLDKLTPWNTSYRLSEYVFRGHTDEEYQLTPNIMRKRKDQTLIEIANMAILQGDYEGALHNIGITEIKLFQATLEMTILRRFYRASNENGLYVPKSKIMSSRMEIDGYIDFDEVMNNFHYNKWLNRDTIEIAALAQHYGLPTRLIDWSFNQYVAAFFASNFTSKPLSTKKISLWMLNYRKLVDLFASSESDIRIFSPHYQWNENAKSQKGLFTYIESTYDRNDEELILNFLEHYKNTNTISTDKKFDVIHTDYRTFDVALDEALTKYNLTNDRKIDTDNLLVKITLPCNEALKVNRYLRDIKISEATIFPGYRGIVEDLKSVLRF
ncbi:FRG domain-containing protein [Enterobacter hormaechei]|uniref:FRG domain-containing protein n=1 Tax=Enterobacter hormaechei TaxID=158836 RepID=UPI003315EA53